MNINDFLAYSVFILGSFSVIIVWSLTLILLQREMILQLFTRFLVYKFLYQFACPSLFALTTDVISWFGLTSPETIFRAREWSDESLLNWVFVYFTFNMPQYLNAGSTIEW